MGVERIANFTEQSYSQIMSEIDGYLSLRLDLSDPIEIGDFAALFAGMGGQFDRYLRQSHPELSGSARMYVKEVRNGSIVADLVPMIPDLVGFMDGALIILGFSGLFSNRIRSWINGSFVADVTKSDLRDANDVVRAITKANEGKAVLTSYKYENGIFTERVEVSFTVQEARKASETIERQIRALDKTEGDDHERVLMVFTRPDINSAKPGKRSGELVKIEKISEKPLALAYASNLVEDRIKSEVRDHDRPIFYRGFIVDVNVEILNGRPVVYWVTHVHDVVDLPDDD